MDNAVCLATEAISTWEPLHEQTLAKYTLLGAEIYTIRYKVRRTRGQPFQVCDMKHADNLVPFSRK